MRNNSRNAVHALIIQAAKTSAQVQQADFPGEPLSGDWDAEAYAIDRAPSWAVLEGPEGDGAWELYAKTLEAEVERLRKRKGASHGEQ